MRSLRVVDASLPVEAETEAASVEAKEDVEDDPDAWLDNEAES